MNQALNFSRSASRRLASTSAKAKNFEITTEIQKENYYKNLGTIQETISKPSGWNEALPYESLPGPKPLPIIGNIWRFLPYIGNFYNMDVLDIHKKFHQQYGNITVLKGIPGIRDTLFVFSPEDFETIHRNEGTFPIRDALKTIAHYRTVTRKDIFQDMPGLTSVHGMQWYNMRSKVNPILMHPKTVLQYVENMDKISSDFIDTLKHLLKSDPKGEMPEDFINYLYRWALESVYFIAIDRRLGCLDPNLKSDSEPQVLVSSAVETFHLYYKLEVQPTLWQTLGSKTWDRFVKVMDITTYTFLKYINEAMKTISEETADKKESEMSVFERLLKIDQKIALTMALDMVTAGVDTTGKTAGAALYYLAKNQNVQSKLREEIIRLLPNKNSPVTKEVLSNALYLKAVIKETTRLAPIAVGNFRTSVKDMVVSGYQIPKGTNILTCNLFLCHSEEYFPRAKEFIPERWLRSTSDELSFKNVNPFIFLPFGFGPRSCIGKRLANLELEVNISKIIRNFILEWHHDDMTFNSIPLYGIAQPLRLQLKELDK